MDTSVSYNANEPASAALMLTETDEQCMAAVEAMDDWDNDIDSRHFCNDIDAWARHALTLNGFGGI